MIQTLAAFPALLWQYHAYDDALFDPSCATTIVLAPCCGRRTPADTVLDVRAVPGTIVAGGGHQPPRDHDWLCDGCRHRLYLDPSTDWVRSTLYSAVGADPEHVRQLHARELAEAAARRDFAAGREHRPGHALATILAALPVGIDPHRRTA